MPSGILMTPQRGLEFHFQNAKVVRFEDNNRGSPHLQLGPGYPPGHIITHNERGGLMSGHTQRTAVKKGHRFLSEPDLASILGK
jgi:hypothetical protein